MTSLMRCNKLRKGLQLCLSPQIQLKTNGTCLKERQFFCNPLRRFHASPLKLSKIYFTESHEWVKVDGKTGTVGITDFAQEKLGDIVFCELPEVGVSYEKGEAFAIVESVKAASDLYIPVSGEVIETNSLTEDHPGLLNESPFDEGWLVKIQLGESSKTELTELLSEEDYEKVKSNEVD